VLWFDRSGYVVLYKRLEQGTFAWPTETDVGVVEMHATDLSLLERDRSGAHASSPLV
jgi:transposase